MVLAEMMFNSALKRKTIYAHMGIFNSEGRKMLDMSFLENLRHREPIKMKKGPFEATVLNYGFTKSKDFFADFVVSNVS